MNPINRTVLTMRLWFLTVVVNVVLIAIYLNEGLGFIIIFTVGTLLGLLITSPLLIFINMIIKLMAKTPFEMIGKFAMLYFLLGLLGTIYYIFFFGFVLRESVKYIEIMPLIFSTVLSIFIACLLSTKQIKSYFYNNNEIVIN